MNIVLLPKNREHGSVLLISMLVTLILAISLASYLVMTQNQNVSVFRAQTWNSSLTVSEAGVEDALAFINKFAGDPSQLADWSRSASVAADNWSSLGNNVFHVRRSVDSSVGHYDVYVTNVNNYPAIFSRGVAYWQNPYASAPQNFFAAVGVTSPDRSTPLVRSVYVQTKIDPWFAVAMAAERNIDFNGKNVQTDSFDSADPNFSDNGLYPTGQPSKTKDGGDVVTNFTITNSLSVGNAKIKGHARTGPNGTIVVGAGGSVGSKAWVESGTPGIQPNWSASDMNVLFPDVKLPLGWGSWLAAPGSQTIAGKNYQHAIMSSGDYIITGLNQSLYIAPNANVRLVVLGKVNLTGANDEIRIAGSGTNSGSLKFYMASSSFSVQGKGVINESGNAANFSYFGLPANTSVSLGGNGSFTGTIYAPSAAFSLGGGGNNVYDFVGSSVTRTVLMNGHFNFHYDENLRRVGPGRGYIPTSWTEVSGL